MPTRVAAFIMGQGALQERQPEVSPYYSIELQA